jgi:hypothetical protein
MIGVTITPSHIDYSKIIDADTVEKLIMGDCVIITGFAKELCPVDTGELKNSIMWAMHNSDGEFNKGGGELAPYKARLRHPHSTEEGYVGSGSDHAGPIETGVAKAYYIRAKPGKMLAWKGKDGKMHFASKVLHPPTKAQPYLRPAADYSKKVREQRHGAIIRAKIKSVYKDNPSGTK